MIKNAAAAPFIYFDGAPAMGVQNGVVEIELVARAVMPKDNGAVYSDMVCVAHLRCSLAAAINLRDAIDRAEDMVEAAQNQQRLMWPGSRAAFLPQQIPLAHND
jgi:hypothetical protein